MAGKVRHLINRSGRYHARLVVPKDLRRVVGKTELRAPLGGDYRQALKLLPGAVAQLQHQIALAERKSGAGAARPSPARYPLATDQLAASLYGQRLEFDDELRNDPRWPSVAIDDLLVQRLRYLSRYDRAFLRLKEAERKLAALPEDTKPGVRFAFVQKVEKAREGVSKALKAAESDLGRKRDGIDEWRTTPDGRAHHAAEKKAKRHAEAEAKGRPVRAYLDLRDLTPEEKAERRKRQKAASARKSRAAKKAAQG